MTARVPAGALAAFLWMLAACSGDPDQPGDREPPGDTGDADGGDDGDGDGADGGDDGGSVDDGLCRAAVVQEVTSAPSPLAADSSLAVTASGVAFAAFTGEATTPAGDPIAAIFLTRLGDDGWSEPERVPADPGLAHQTPELVAEGETLHLAWSTTRAGSAVRDISYAARVAGEWSAPLDLTAGENQGARTSTAVRDLAVSAGGVLAVVYGSHDPTDATQAEEAPRVQFLSPGEPPGASIGAPVEGFRCDGAAAVHDNDDILHVVATCFLDGAPGDSALWYGTIADDTWETSAYLAATRVGQHVSPSLINIAAPRSNLIWEQRAECQAGVCGSMVYGLVDDPAAGLVLGADLSPLNPSSSGIGTPSAVVDSARRVSIVFDHSGSGAAGDIFVTRAVQPTTYLDPPFLDRPCRVEVAPDVDERFPEAVADRSTGDVHILFQVVEEDGVRLAHARLPAL